MGSDSACHESIVNINPVVPLTQEYGVPIKQLLHACVLNMAEIANIGKCLINGFPINNKLFYE